MRSLFRSPALVTPLVVAFVLTGCDGDTSPPPTPGPTTPSNVPTDAGPGNYTYGDLGLDATLAFEGDEGTLEVANGTGGALGAPTPYVLDAESGAVIELRVTPAEPIPDGASARVTVSFPEGARPIGLVILRFGEDEYGAMLPEGAA